MRIGDVKNSSWVRKSKSRKTVLATKAVVTKVPMMLITRRSCMMTKGAFRWTRPMAPPKMTASVVTARNVSRKKKNAEIQKRGCRSW